MQCVLFAVFIFCSQVAQTERHFGRWPVHLPAFKSWQVGICFIFIISQSIVLLPSSRFANTSLVSVYRASADRRARQKTWALPKILPRLLTTMWQKKAIWKTFFSIKPWTINPAYLPQTSLSTIKSMSTSKTLSHNLPMIFILQLRRNIPRTIMTLTAFCFQRNGPRSKHPNPEAWNGTLFSPFWQNST